MSTKFTSERIREIRDKMGLSQEGLARELGISAATVHRWENGKTKPGQMAVKLLELMLEQVGEKEQAETSH